jgi:hypothetical protein
MRKVGASFKITNSYDLVLVLQLRIIESQINTWLLSEFVVEQLHDHKRYIKFPWICASQLKPRQLK